MYISLNTGAIRLSVSFRDALRLAQAHSFPALDLPIPELVRLVEETSLEEIQDQLAQAFIRPGGWGLPIEFRRDEATYQDGLQALPRYAALAQALGCTRTFTYILPFSDELDYAANMSFHVERLRPVAQILEDHGIRLAIEFVGPKTLRQGHRYEFIHTIDGAIELGNQLGTHNVGILLDSYHWYTSHSTVADIEQLYADQVVYVHVNDAPPKRQIDEQLDGERLLPGDSGVINITGFLQALQRIHYDGPVVVEPFSAELSALPPDERVHATRASLRKIWQDAGLA